MTVRVPSWLQAGSYTADSDRLLLQSLLGGSPNQALSSGVVGLADLAITQTTTASMNLKVAAGSAWLVGSQSSTEGVYNIVNDDATQTVTISTADATNPRIDLVVLQVRNAEYSGANNDAVLAVIKGTAAPSPAAPAAPTDSIVLAQIAVAANALSIVTANITDKRTFFAPLNLARGMPEGRLTVSGSQAFTAGQTKAVVMALDHVQGGMTKSGNTLVVPVAGVYRVSANIVWGTTSASQNAYLSITQNGTQVRWRPSLVNPSSFVSNSLTSDIKCAAGDALGVTCIAALTASSTLQGDATDLTGDLTAVLVSQ